MPNILGTGGPSGGGVCGGRLGAERWAAGITAS